MPFSLGPVHISLHPAHGWIRYKTYVFSWKHRTVPPLFSERQGYIRYRRLGPYRFRWERER